MEPLNRRRFLRSTATLAASTWMTPLGQHLARAQEKEPAGSTAQSVIVLWMAGGPSQLETFDPHEGSRIAGGTRQISTAVKGIALAQGLEQVAEEMASISLVRSMMSRR